MIEVQAPADQTAELAGCTSGLSALVRPAGGVVVGDNAILAHLTLFLDQALQVE